MSMEPLLADRETDRGDTLPEAVRLAIERTRRGLIEARNSLRDDLHEIDKTLRDGRMRREIVRNRLVVMDAEIEQLSEYLIRHGIDID